MDFKNMIQLYAVCQRLTLEIQSERKEKNIP